MSGACNYLFPAVLTTAFYIIFSRSSHKTTSYDYACLPLLWLFGFIAGWTNEGFVVGMASGCILFFIVRRELITRRRIALLAGYICGAIPLCLSPLNTARLFDSHKDCAGLYDHIHAFAVSVYSMTNAPLSITLAILAATAVVAPGRAKALRTIRSFAADHIIILTAWGVSAIFIIITRYTSDYSRIPTELYATILLIAAASRLNARTLGALSLPAAIGMTITAMYTLPASAGNARTYACLRGSIARGERVIGCSPYPLNRFERRYIVPLSQCSFGHTIMGQSKDIILKYYKADPATEIVPCELIGLRGQELAPDRIMHLPLWGMYFIKLRPEADVSAVSFILSPDTKCRGISFGTSRRNREASEMPAQKHTVISLPDGTRWLGVHKNGAIASRVSNIRITCRSKHDNAIF